MAITYRRNDERPPWRPTIIVNGAAEDLSAGFAFTVRIAPEDDPEDLLLEKTAGIIGEAEGVVSVNWDVGELDIEPGSYEIHLIARRTADDLEWSVADEIVIKTRL